MLWSVVEAFNIILIMPLWNVSLPTNASMLFEVVFQIATFSIVPTDKIWNYCFPNMSKKYVMINNFE